MYPNKKNILELVALMLQFDIEHIVIAPGSRNAPLSQAFASDDRFTCYSITDERSATFFALGLTQALHKPVAVCCTSGSALLNTLPAVSEAYYQQLPLLVISADRPTEWIGQMDGQTIHQANMGSSIFRKSVHLPEIKGTNEHWYCNRLINEALLSLHHRIAGPVHINIPLSEPLFDFSITELPDVRKIERCAFLNNNFELPTHLQEQWKKAKKPMIIVGQQSLNDKINKGLQALASKKGCVILAEHIANIHEMQHPIYNFDSILYATKDNKELIPDLIIYLGGHIVSKRLKALIRENNQENLWLISPEGEVVDTFKCLSVIIEAEPLNIIEALERIDKDSENEYQNTWYKLSDEIKKRSDNYTFPDFSDLFVTKTILEHLPDACIQLANSSVVRNAQLFQIHKVKEVFANRGTSGIEGSMSTAVGYSVAKEVLTYLLIGDLSFFYDMNALWNKYLSGKLRILVINNGNGQIFNTLGGLQKSEIISDFIAGVHQTSVKAWVEDRGCRYLSAKNRQEFELVIPEFCNEEIIADKPIVLEVFTDADMNTTDLKEFYKHLKI